MRPHLALGITRFPMHRQLGAGRPAATLRLSGNRAVARARCSARPRRQGRRLCARRPAPSCGPRVLASPASTRRTAAACTSTRKTNAGRVYFAAERMLGRMTDAFIFVSQYEAAPMPRRSAHHGRRPRSSPNGLEPEEFEPVTPNPDAARLPLHRRSPRPERAGHLHRCAGSPATKRPAGRRPLSIVGGGEDKPHYMTMAAEAGLADIVSFRDPMPAREAFRLAHTVVVPSRAESMPYIVLEAVAAGMPADRHPSRRHPRDLRTGSRSSGTARRPRRTRRCHGCRARRPRNCPRRRRPPERPDPPGFQRRCDGRRDRRRLSRRNGALRRIAGFSARYLQF